VNHLLDSPTEKQVSCESLWTRVHPKVKDLLDSQIAAAHDEMKKIDPETLGSFQRTVTTSDGAWHHRGFHSGNASYVVINYFNKALLKYGHVSMRAKSPNNSPTPCKTPTTSFPSTHRDNKSYIDSLAQRTRRGIRWEEGLQHDWGAPQGRPHQFQPQNIFLPSGKRDQATVEASLPRPSLVHLQGDCGAIQGGQQPAVPPSTACRPLCVWDLHHLGKPNSDDKRASWPSNQPRG